MFSKKDITVLIATKDRIEEIQRAIQSSLDQSIKANIVVLDDSSEINIREQLENKFKGNLFIHVCFPLNIDGEADRVVSGYFFTRAKIFECIAEFTAPKLLRGGALVSALYLWAGC